MGGCDLYRPAAKLLVDVFIGNNRDLAVNQGQQDFLADQALVTFIFRVNGDGSIAEHRFWSSRRHDQVTIGADNRISQMPEMPLFVLMFHFEV